VVTTWKSPDLHGDGSATTRALSAFVSVLAGAYRPRRPTETVLYALVREHLETFSAGAYP
jgi:hypothetical protein